MAGGALDLLTGDARAFRDQAWATRAHRHQVDPGQLGDLLTLDDVDRLLTSTAARTPAVRLAQDGSVLPESAYTRRGATLAGKPLTGLVDTRRVLRGFEEGATVVLQGLHRYWEPVGDLVARLELDLGHPCQANAYLTPPGAQGFAVHSDTHDVFVVQTHGSKTWEVHDGPSGPDEPREVVLEPGVAMYLPTGTPHAARAQQTASLHVTIGVNQLTWRHLVRRTVDHLVEGVPDEHLPAGYLDDPEALVAGLREQFAQLSGVLGAVDPRRAADHQVERFLTGRHTRQRGGLRDTLAVAGIDEGTRLRRRPGHACVVVPGRERDRVLLGDRELGVPARVRPALELVAACDELRPGDLTMLDPESRLVLCRRLVREGLLEVVPA